MVSKVISISEKVNNLSLFGRLLYTWMIPHTDDFGRMPGSPAKVRALVVPMGDETVKDVETALSDMSKRNLIHWYEVEGDRYIQIVNFDEHQQGLHKRTKSKFPDPPDDSQPMLEVSENFPGIPSELELELEKKDIDVLIDGSTESQESPENFYNAHKRIFGLDCNPFQIQQLIAYIEQDGLEESVIIRAFERAAINSKTGYNFKLITGILDTYFKNGVRTLEQATKQDNAFDANRDKGPPRNRGADRSVQKRSVVSDLRKKAQEERARGQSGCN
jgi:DnaD/phage-associated family protein